MVAMETANKHAGKLSGASAGSTALFSLQKDFLKQKVSIIYEDNSEENSARSGSGRFGRPKRGASSRSQRSFHSFKSANSGAHSGAGDPAGSEYSCAGK